MMENVRKISKRYYVRQIVACWLVWCMFFGLPLRVAMAEVVMTTNPTGTITVTPLGVGITQDMTATHGAIGNFSDFDIAATHIVTCEQTIAGVPDALSQALFRVSGDGTEIYGTFNANGGIWLINPAGIIFGNNASVNVNQLVASSLNISDADFTNGLATGSFQFIGGGIGDVINEGVITAEAIALIGRHVINRGRINGDYVIMAAGDSVLITGDPSSSDVVVEVAMANPAHHVVDHGGNLGTGPGTIRGADTINGAEYVILAAGDIWSAAIEGVEGLRAEAKRDVVIEGTIYAYSDGSSDAIAGVEILAGGDVTVNDEVWADTYVDSGNPDDDAISTVEITAGGDVYINANVKAKAKVENGSGNATADTRITGEYIDIDGKTVARAITDNSGDAESNIVIAARGDVNIDDEVKSKASSVQSGDATSDIKISGVNIDIVYDGSAVTSRAQAGFNHNHNEDDDYSGNSGDATAGVDIAASGIVNVDGRVIAHADAQNNSGSADATTKIVGTQVNITGGVGYTDGHGETADQSVVAQAHTWENSGNATANVDIEATTGNVLIDTDGYWVSAEAGVENPNNKYDGDATATLSITAGDDGDVDIYDDVKAKAEAEGDAGDATATINVNAGRDIEFDGDGEYGGEDGYSDLGAYTYTEEGSGNAIAVYNINAGRDVLLNARIKSKVEAYDSGDATTQITITGRNITTNDRIISRIKNNGSGNSKGTIDIIARGDVDINGEDDWDYGVNNKIEAGNGAGNATANTTITGQNITITDAAVVSRASTWDESGDATANVNVEAAGNLDISTTDGYSYGAWVKSNATTDDDSGDATAATTIKGVDITIAGHRSGDDDGSVIAKADADDSGSATANLNVDASGNILLKDEAYVGSEADADDSSATATVDITLTGSDVTVGDGSSIYAEADVYSNEALLGVPENGPETRDATAEVTILADGQVTVEEAGQIYTDATVHIDYPSVEGQGDNDNGNGDNGNGSGVGDPVEIPGDATATTTINADAGVTVEGSSGREPGQIYADASIEYYFQGGSEWEPTVVDGFRPDATANVDIQTCGNVIVDGLIGSHAWIYDTSATSYPENLFGDATADVIVKAYGDVIVNSEDEEENGFLEINNSFGGSNGQIEAEAQRGLTNSAGVTILAVGDVIVNNGSAQGRPQRGFIYSPEEILASAHGGYGGGGYTNNAFVHIATREGDAGDVIVSGQISANTWIAQGEGDLPPSNTSNVEIYADQDLIVYGGDAFFWDIVGDSIAFSDNHEGGQITAGAGNGPINTANVDIYAGRDVIVHGAELIERPIEPSGGEVYFDGGQILALTWGSGGGGKNGDLGENTSSIGIYAQDDVTIHGATIKGDPPEGEEPPFVIDGQVLAAAHGEDNILDADVVICAQDDVTVDGEIIAEAGTTIDPDNEHYADIVIAAGNADGDPAGGITGSGWIYAEADPSAKVAEASIVLRTPDAGNIVIPITDEHFGIMDDDNPGGDGLPDTETGPVDCPDCDFEWIDWTWCVDCEEGPFVLAAPIFQTEIPRILGCPLEMAVVALELGTTPEAIQVAIADALALNPTIQPCQACATLIDAAAILRDEDGSRMAAMLAVFNELAPADAPFTPEMGASIVTAFAGAAEGSQYASVAEYMDAFVQYVAVVDVDLGSPVEDSLAFVMEKYGTDITESENSNLAAFVATRLEAGETFAQ